MADAALKTKAPVPAPVAGAKPVQTLREAQPKKFPQSKLQALGHDYDRLAVSVPSDWTFADVMKPIAWTHVCAMVAKDALNTRRDKIGSVIEVHSEKFYADVVIRKVVVDHLGGPCGLDVFCIGPSRDATGTAAPVDLTTGRAWVDPAIMSD